MKLIELTDEVFDAIKEFKYGQGNYTIWISGESKYGNFIIEYRLQNNAVNQIWVANRVSNNPGTFIVTPDRFSLEAQHKEAERFFSQIIDEGNFDTVEVRCKPENMAEIYNMTFNL
jgi:hypothetical protein